MPRATEWPQSYWAAIGRDTQSFVGCFQFRPRDNHGGGIELGFRLKLAEWGKGFATEGSRALIAKGFSQLGVRRVFARTMASNAASIQVVEKIGLKSDKTERQVNSVQYKMVRLTILSTRSNSGQRDLSAYLERRLNENT